MTRGQRKFSGAKKKMAEKMAKNALMGGQRIPQYITTKNQRGQRIRKLNPEYKAIYGSANLKNRPLKIDNKGLTPNVQVKKKAPVKNKVKAKTETRAEMLKRKTGSTYDPTKANRAGQRMGQRKAGGMLKSVDKEKNPGLAKLPTEVRNRMGFMKKGGDVNKKAGKAARPAELDIAIAKIKKKPGMKKDGMRIEKKMYGGGMTKKKMYGGGMTKKKMMGGGMTIKKMKHGGKAGKCPRDGIAMKGKTRAGR